MAHGQPDENLTGRERLAQFDAHSYCRKYKQSFDFDEVPEEERRETARLVADAVLAEPRRTVTRTAETGAGRDACHTPKRKNRQTGRISNAAPGSKTASAVPAAADGEK